jgi:hypothetical protein
MGSAIALHLSEIPVRHTRINGVLSIGAALLADDPADRLPFRYDPEVPVAFLTNIDEVSMIEEWINKCESNELRPISFSGAVFVPRELFGFLSLTAWYSVFQWHEMDTVMST